MPRHTLMTQADLYCIFFQELGLVSQWSIGIPQMMRLWNISDDNLDDYYDWISRTRSPRETSKYMYWRLHSGQRAL